MKIRDGHASYLTDLGSPISMYTGPYMLIGLNAIEHFVRQWCKLLDYVGSHFIQLYFLLLSCVMLQHAS